MAAAFRLGQTVRIEPGTYHGMPRPAYGTVIGEGARESTWRVTSGGWHMTYSESDLTDGTGHGAEAAGYANGGLE
jgi:hypothetical protein